MSKDLAVEVDQDHFRERLNKYTRKAFLVLPKLEKPHILDIGCGSGVPTIELAKLSGGEINQAIVTNHPDIVNKSARATGRDLKPRPPERALFVLDIFSIEDICMGVY